MLFRSNENNASTTFVMPSKAVTVTATFKALPPATYSITVQNDGHGTANANVTSASAGIEITLTATPNSGYKFKEWQVVSGGVTVTANKFTMPGNAVTVKAIFEVLPPTTYAVTVTGGTADKAVAAEGETVTITAGTAPAGQTFDKWTTSDGVSFANENNASTTFVMPSKAVSVTATFKALPAGTYAITVQNDGNGTANADVTSAASGSTINLAATPSTGYKFKEWQVIGGGVTLADKDSATTTFTMPGETVTIKAIFELMPYAVTVTGSYATTSGANNYTMGETVTINAGTRSNYTFNGWTVTSGGVTLANASNATTTFVMPANAVTVTAGWTYTGGGGGGGGGGTTSYTVKFETNGGSSVSSQTVTSGGKATKPTDPTKDGYTFAGWYSNTALTTEYNFKRLRATLLSMQNGQNSP